MTDKLPAAREARTALAPLLSAEVGDDLAVSILARAAWCQLVEPGDGVAGRLIAALGPEAALAEVTSGSRGDAGREATELTAKEWSDAVDRWRPRWDRESVLANLALAGRCGIRLLVPEHETWPVGLLDLGPHAPLCLWVRGEPTALSRTSLRVAVVGARAASSYGEHVAMELSAELSARNVTVVSGAAYGIDGAAHRSALHGGGTTIAILAGGVDRPYPAGHADLIGRIARTGAVISEVPCGSAPTKWRFLQRNRLIAALADATVVVEAGWRSGSLNTAAHSAALARPLGAVPGPVTSAASAGCHRLLREFDARCVTNADEVMELLSDTAPSAGTTAPSQARPRRGGADLPVPAPALFDLPTASSPGSWIAPGPRSMRTVAAQTQSERAHLARTDDTTRVLDAMSARSWRTAEDIARRAGMALGEAAAILGLLELEERAVRGEAGWRRRS